MKLAKVILWLLSLPYRITKWFIPSKPVRLLIAASFWFAVVVGGNFATGGHIIEDIKSKVAPPPAAAVPPAPPGPEPKNSAEWAQRILNEKKIGFTAYGDSGVDQQETNNVRDAIALTAQGKKVPVTNFRGRYVELDDRMLKVMWQLSQKYRYEVGYIANGYHLDNVDDSWHYYGKAFDVESINGHKASGGAADIPFIRDAANFLSPQGGIGQSQCGSGSVKFPAGVAHFRDSCDHVHINTGPGSHP